MFRIIDDGRERIVQRYSYMDFDEKDDEIWRQGEIEHPSFEAFWKEATVNEKWFRWHPVYVHDECNPIVRKSLANVDVTEMTEDELASIDEWKDRLSPNEFTL